MLFNTVKAQVLTDRLTLHPDWTLSTANTSTSPRDVVEKAVRADEDLRSRGAKAQAHGIDMLKSMLNGLNA